MTPTVLLIDDDPASEAALEAALAGSGLSVEVATDSRAAIRKLATARYCAIVLDPMIRHRLNGYAVLSYIELEEPQLLSRVFLLTGMSAQTIARTAPMLVTRLHRKSSDVRALAAAVIAPTEPGTIPERGESKGAVLLVEDDPTTAKVMTAALEELGYSCHWIANGRTAAETASDYDLIMLDLVMPDVDGFTLLKRLEATQPDLLRRVIVTTGMPAKYLEDLDREKLCGVVQKPVDLQTLRRLLDCCYRTTTAEPGGEYPAMY